MPPLVSAIMPTRGRRELAALALQCFLEQDYPSKELIILDDDLDRSFSFDAASALPEDVQYFSLPGLNIPQKRNRCCELAKGEIVMHFDSDDWSAPGRMANQAALLEASGKSVTGYHSMLFLVAHEGEWRRYRGARNYACGTSLAYLRAWWLRHPFATSQTIGEDNGMVAVANTENQFIAVDGGELMFARIHPGNTGPKDKNGFDLVSTPESIPRGIWDSAAALAR